MSAEFRFLRPNRNVRTFIWTIWIKGSLTWQTSPAEMIRFSLFLEMLIIAYFVFIFGLEKFSILANTSSNIETYFLSKNHQNWFLKHFNPSKLLLLFATKNFISDWSHPTRPWISWWKYFKKRKFQPGSKFGTRNTNNVFA